MVFLDDPDYRKLVKETLFEVKDYTPGKSVEYVKRKYGLDRVIKLASNENSFGASRKAIEEFKKFEDLHIYPPSQPETLIHKISEYLGVEEDRIVLGAGIDGVLENIFKIFIERGDRVLLSPPTFPYYHILVRIFSGKEVECGRDENFRMTYSGEKFKLAIVCSPNNPTGNVERKEVVEDIIDSGGIVFIDEAYAEFSDENLLEFAEEENVIVARTLSKAFGLANMRVGYAVLPEWIKKLYLKVSTPFPLSTPAINSACAVLEDLDYLRWVVEEIKRERERVFRELSKHVKVYPSQANFLFARLDVSSRYLCELLMSKGVIIRDCSGFKGCRDGDIRVTIGRSDENSYFIEKFLEVMDEMGGGVDL